MTNRFVAVELEGKIQTHLPSHNQDYYTLCGMDGGFEGAKEFSGQQTAKPGKKVDCPTCRAIFDACREYHVKDFV